MGRIDRPSQTLDPESVGLSLADRKQLLHNLVIPAQAGEICTLRRICRRCYRWTALKDYRQCKVDTVFGTVSFRSPRIVSCACEPPWYLETAFCPLWPIIPERATPELLALQAKLAAQMPYRWVVETMREFLQVSEKFNHVTVRNRTLRVGTRIDAIELPGAQPRTPLPNVPWRSTEGSSEEGERQKPGVSKFSPDVLPCRGRSRASSRVCEASCRI